MSKAVIRVVLAVAVVLMFAIPAAAQCPVKFKLSGKIGESWSKVTSSEWKKMLPKGWTDKGFHFYSRARERGPENGINTPSDLEDAIRGGKDQAAGGNRRQIVLNISNDRGAKLKVFYDWDGNKKSKCELVTLSY